MFRLKMGGKDYGTAPGWMHKTFAKQGFSTKAVVPKRKRITGRRSKNIAAITYS